MKKTSRQTSTKNDRTTFDIDKNVPIPARRSTRKSFSFPFQKMEIGDSFYAHFGGASVVSAANSYGRKHKQKFITREQQVGIRVWRIQ